MSVLRFPNGSEIHFREEPMKLAYRQLNNRDFAEAMAKLEQSQTLPIKTAVKISRLAKRLKEEGQLARSGVERATEKHVEMEQETVRGKIVNRPKKDETTGGMAFKDQAAWEQELEDLMSSEFDAIFTALTLDEVADVGLSAKDITALGPIIEDPDAGPQLVTSI